MNIQLTSVLLGIYTLFYIFLAMRIGYMRGSPVMKLFFKMDEPTPEAKLQRNVRAHGNFSEYVPIFFILLLTSELIGANSYSYLLTSCCIFSYGRLAHAICFAFYDHNPFLRISGMMTTYMGLIMLAIGLMSF